MAKISTHYDTLNVARNAPSSVIKAAYKALCQTYHPDKYQGDRAEAERIMKSINASYQILIDPDQRAKYDRLLDELESNTKQHYEYTGFHETNESPKKGNQQRQNKYDNSDNPSEDGNLDLTIAGGGVRCCARLFDLWWEMFFTEFVLSYVLSQFSTSYVYWLNNNPSASIYFPLFCLPISLAFDAFIYSAFGYTLGKFWLGIIVRTSDGKALTFFQYLCRNLKLYLSGLALGLPIIGLFTMANQSIRLRKGQYASYDESTGSRVFAKPAGWVQKISFGFAFVSLLFTMSLLDIISRSPQPSSTSSTSQEIPSNPTPQAENQTNSSEDLSQRANELLNQGKYAQALPLITQLANQNNASWQRLLGEMYQQGQGVTQNYNQAIYWYSKAVEQEEIIALNNLGGMYDNGIGVAKDFKQAFSLFNKAANKGDAKGQYNLGFMYSEGHGVAQNDRQAAFWFAKAAEQGLTIAEYVLGILYANGLGVTKNMNDAVFWLRKAEQHGSNDAKVVLRQLNASSSKSNLITETNDRLQVEGENGTKFEIKGNLSKIKEEMRESRFSRVKKPTYDSDIIETETKHECIIKPVMTKKDLDNCRD